MPDSVSPLAPTGFPALAPIAGVRLATAQCGIRYPGRRDLMVAVLAPGSRVAGVFTRSLTPGAPVDWCRQCLPHGKARAIVVNSGNANVFTGRKGRRAVEETAKTAARLLGCPAREIYVCSTGVIGEPLPAEKIVAALPEALAGSDEARWAEAAQAIMTTDTFAKGATATALIDGARVTLNGIAKGSGMIAPDMGDDVGLCLHRRGLAGAGPAGALEAGERALLQLDHGRWRHFHQRHAAAHRDRRGKACAHRRGQRSPAQGFPPRARRGHGFDWRSRSCATARGRRNSSPSTSPARPRRRRRGGSASPSATRPWSRPRSPRATPIGAASSWRLAKPARRPTATGSRSRWAASPSPSAASPRRAMTRRRWRATWPAATSR